jgi:hypothetical protein
MSLMESYRFINSEEYRQATAERKREMMWQAMLATPYDLLPPNTFNAPILFSYIKTMWKPWLKATFTDHNPALVTDVRPPRTKSFSAYGVVGKVRMVIEDSHGFSGFFESGGIGITRLTIVMDTRWYMPGMSIKFFVDHKPSESLMLGPSLDPQNPNRDYFAYAHTNRMPVPRRLPFGPVWWSGMADMWMGPISNPLENELDNLAMTNQKGEEITPYKAPYQIFLEATPEARIHTDSEEDFRMELGRFQTGTVLLKVMVKPTKDSPSVYMGYIQTESELITSEFADRVFAQRHRTLPFKQS